MNKLNKVIYATVATALLISTGVMAGNVGTMNTFSSGTPAVANDVNANFTEQTTQINDNNSRLIAVEDKGPKTLTSSVKMVIPNLDPGTAGDTIVRLLLRNTTGTTCTIVLSQLEERWVLGQNALVPSMQTASSAQRILTGTQVIGTDIVISILNQDRNLGDISGQIFVDYQVTRLESDPADTCGPNDVVLYGARVSTPNGQFHWIPLSAMKVK